MSILPITVFGDDILRKKAAPVTEIKDDIVEIVDNMFSTMINANGIGLAANQVGINRRIFVIDVSAVEGYEKFKPMVFINPKIVSKSDELESFEEGCLSIPELKANVIRPKGIEISFYDLNMKEHKMETDDLVARVIQHELDHLNGVLFIDYLDEETKKKIKKHLNKIKNRKVEVNYPITKSPNYLLYK
ncbi:MAG: peptide deformylase [Ignavibacterium sp.]|nr:peptide deformylase [Ignavibacterium sp.]MCX7611619.1 peptide deformylase [Ignavibacterium sp.]MDW8374703.1 peptide deformylase [Ignavibacteriales bacterium]